MQARIGFQLSSIAPYLKDASGLANAFEKIARIGYRDVQLQGASMDISDREIARALADAGLNCIATQEDYPDGFGDCPERYIERAVACGAEYLTFAVIPRQVDSTEQLARFADRIAEIHGAVRAAGLTFAFHPIGCDYALMDGVPVYERLMALLPPEMQLTFCVHSTFGTPVHYQDVLRKYRGRMDVMHFKDSVLLPDGRAQLMPLGQGRTDWRPVYRMCAEAGAKWILAEQETWQKDAFDSAQDSWEYLKEICAAP